MGIFSWLFGKKKEESAVPEKYVESALKKNSEISAVQSHMEPEDIHMEENPVELLKKDEVRTATPEVKNNIPVANTHTILQIYPCEEWTTFEENGKNGYEDVDGNKMIPAIFDEAHGFRRGLATVKMGRKIGMINDKGIYVIQPEYDFIYEESEGLIQVEKDDLCGFYKPNGTLHIPLIYNYASDFSDGLACVSKDELYGFIDRDNNVVLDFQYEEAGDFSEGLAPVGFENKETGDSKFGFIDKTGKLIISAQFEDAKNFREGYAPVQLNGKWTFIDKTGRMVSIPVYHEAKEFYQGRASVQVTEGGKWGFADHQGQLVIRCQFDYSSDFMEQGFAFVYIGNKCLTLYPDGTFKS